MDLGLTLDYELFGNGAGNIFNNLILPTQKVLNLCKKYNAKITIFFEVIEYLKLKQEWEKGNKMGYNENPALAMEKQIKEALNNGHDVQLHIHPQWLNAKFVNNHWQVDNNWCMKNIPLYQTKEFDTDLKTVLLTGQKVLENLLKPINSDYKCNIFRAGGFNILPSESVFRILTELGFIADSSVFAGGYEINELSNVDFTIIKNNIPYWFVKDYNVLNQDQEFVHKETIIELPIFSYPIMRIFKYDLHRIKIVLKNKTSSLQKIQTRALNKSKIEKIKFFFEKEFVTWDFCLFNQKKMNFFLKKAFQVKKTSKYKYHPFILIGHSKSFYDDKTLKRLLKKQNVQFLTVTNIIKKIFFYTLNGHTN
ncbi:hypothetical protein LA303_00380 [Candidatus Sulfidibacterium hydrothermale]|uniref:hypothetical protein n=1 Tax=Candidatus Sulfidibacterium hydrothermale TaxID=2875962 RepID=UPI001F0AA6F3|nr:hypothetical protein [Candidatus Sulfidibacterium hydrothermale]UBM62453.1 hypothetical protein LA303_00380 [Candidatus Sulfidibacterium hydrothermale]